LKILGMRKYLATFILFFALTSCKPYVVGNEELTPRTAEILEHMRSLEEKRSKTSLDIAVMVPLSGEQKELGQQLLNSTFLALHHVKDETANIYPIDINKYVYQDKEVFNLMINNRYDVIIGPVFADHTRKIYKYAHELKVPLFSFSNDAKLEGHEGLYLLGMRPDQQIYSALEYGVSQGYKKVYAVLPETKYGRFIKNTLYQLEDLGYKYYETKSYRPLKGRVLRGVDEAVQQIYEATKGKEDEVMIFIPEGDYRLLRIVKQFELAMGRDESIKDKRVRFNFFGTDQWDTEERLWRRAVMEGSWFASAPRDRIDQYNTVYKEIYGKRPMKISTLAYDSAVFILNLYNKNRAEPRPLSNTNVSNSDSFEGIAGRMKFVNSNNNKRDLDIYKIQDKRLLKIVKGMGPPAAQDISEENKNWGRGRY
jgi:branched-chain amino acid transport system substrate-binding protein